MVLACARDIQWCSIVPPVHGGVRNSVYVREAVENGQAILLNSEVCWTSLDD